VQYRRNAKTISEHFLRAFACLHLAQIVYTSGVAGTWSCDLLKDTFLNRVNTSFKR